MEDDPNTATEILRRHFHREETADEDAHLMDEIRLAGDIAQQVYDARIAAGLSHEELARQIGSDTSVIDDVESADYDGDALSVLHRVANALHLRLEVNLRRAS